MEHDYWNFYPEVSNESQILHLVWSEEHYMTEKLIECCVFLVEVYIRFNIETDTILFNTFESQEQVKRFFFSIYFVANLFNLTV